MVNFQHLSKYHFEIQLQNYIWYDKKTHQTGLWSANGIVVARSKSKQTNINVKLCFFLFQDIRRVISRQNLIQIVVRLKYFYLITYFLCDERVKKLSQHKTWDFNFFETIKSHNNIFQIPVESTWCDHEATFPRNQILRWRYTIYNLTITLPR